MNRPKISTATVMPKLRGILNNDIEVLNGMLRSRSEDSDMYALVDSLIYVKQKILKLLPDTNGGGINESPTTGQRKGIKGYKIKNSTEVKDQYLMTDILLDIETKQHNFVKAAITDDGLPDNIKSIIKEIAEIYETIVDQIGRSKKTQQINPIVI